MLGSALKADNKGKNSKIVEAEKAVSKKDQKQEKAENKKEPEKKDTSSKGNEKKDDGKKETPLYHIVKADQTIYAISREYNVPVNRLFSQALFYSQLFLVFDLF